MTLSWPVSVALFKLQIAIMWGLWAHYKVVCSVNIEKCVNFMFSCTYLQNTNVSGFCGWVIYWANLT